MRMDRILSLYTPQNPWTRLSRPHTGSLYDEVPHLKMTRASNDEKDSSVEASMPLMFNLRCRLEPRFIMDKTKATYVLNGKGREPVHLFLLDERPSVSAVDVVFDGDGAFMEPHREGDGQKMKAFQGVFLGEHQLALKTHLLHKHVFDYPKEHVLVNQTNLIGHNIIDPPGLDDIQPFFPFGGAFYPMIKLTDIQQYYCTITASSTHTIVTPYSIRALMDRGMRPYMSTPQRIKGLAGKMAIISPFLGTRSPSLYDHIFYGNIQVKLAPKGSENPKDIVTYKSFQVEQLGISRFINLSFKRNIP